MSKTAPGWLADRISAARADAERIARELEERGLLSGEDVTRVAQAVDGAVERGRELIVDALREPRRILAALRPEDAAADPASRSRAGATHAADAASDRARADARDLDHARARIDALERRVAALEDALLHARNRRGSESD